MATSPMDLVIGAGSSADRDIETAQRHFHAATNLANAGDKLGAITELRKAVGADSANVDAMFQLAYLLDLVGEEDEALSLYERVCESTPAPINGLLNLDLGVGVFVDLGAEQRHQVLPRLDERIGHLCCPAFE